MSLRSRSAFRGLLLVLVVASFPRPAAATVLLYQNYFELPNGFVDTTGKDVSQQSVSTLYDQPGFAFQQINTVETLEIHGGTAFGTGYSDPQGIGGDYTPGMLSAVQDDHLALTFDVGSFAFLNVGMDISAIDLDGVGGPFGVTEPIFRLRLYDSPGGVFSIVSPGTLLDQVDVTGTGTASASVFDWTAVVGALSASGSQDGHVSLDIDLIQGGYAGFDNLRVVASDTPGLVPEPATSALVVLGLCAMAGFAARRRRIGCPKIPPARF